MIDNIYGLLIGGYNKKQQQQQQLNNKKARKKYKPYNYRGCYRWQFVDVDLIRTLEIMTNSMEIYWKIVDKYWIDIGLCNKTRYG